MKLRTMGMLAVAMLGTACVGTHVTGSWKSPELPDAYQPKKVLVVGLVPERSRGQLEDELVMDLRAEGIESIPSKQFIASDQELSRATVEKVVKEQGFDSVLLTTYQGTEKQVSYDPHMLYGPYIDYYSFYGGGTVRTTETVKLQTDLFDANTGERIWSANFDSFEPGNAAEAIPDVVDAIVARMERDFS